MSSWLDKKTYNTRSENFKYIYETDTFTASFQVMRCKNRRHPEALENLVIGELQYMEVDDYKIANQVLTFSEALTVEEYKEILEEANDLEFSIGAYYIRVLRANLSDNNLMIALTELGYVVDEIDGYLVLARKYKPHAHHFTITAMFLFIMYSYLTHQQMIRFASLGLIIGVALGGAYDLINRRKFDDIERKRRDRR